MNTRNTKQKEIILETLCELSTHPTILELYHAVHLRDASIGQATIYRNISKLIEEGKVRKILSNDGVFHYDGNCTNHSHFVCRVCHRLFDLYDVDTNSFISKLQNLSSFDVEKAHVLFEGVCSKCR